MLYTIISSERGKPATKSGNDFIKIELTTNHKVTHMIEYSAAGIRLNQKTAGSGAIVYESRTE